MDTPKDRTTEVDINDWDDDEPTLPIINLKTIKTPLPMASRWVGWRKKFVAWFELLLLRLGLR